MILLDSVQKVLMKYGKAEQCDKNNVIIYKWHGKQTGIVMVDNRNEWNWLRVSTRLATISSTGSTGLTVSLLTVTSKRLSL
uniref:Pecanex-like protein n=1 Tax=Caenorhabditis tropicalis TaxID=1561998 RepID=A0A1I7UMB2_9PELO